MINTILYSKKRRSFIPLKPPEYHAPPEEPLRLTLIAWEYYGINTCNINNSFSQGQDMTNWVGDSNMSCTAYDVTGFSLMWWEMEHNRPDKPFYISVWCGAHIETCPGYAKLYLGYPISGGVFLKPITDIVYTWTQPGQITLYGTFPYPRFAIGLYHECYSPPTTLTGVRLVRHEAWEEQ